VNSSVRAPSMTRTHTQDLLILVKHSCLGAFPLCPVVFHLRICSHYLTTKKITTILKLFSTQTDELTWCCCCCCCGCGCCCYKNHRSHSVIKVDTHNTTQHRTQHDGQISVCQISDLLDLVRHDSSSIYSHDEAAVRSGAEILL